MNTTPKPLIQLNAEQSNAWREHHAHLDVVKEWARHIKKYAQDHLREYDNDRRLITRLADMLNSKRSAGDHVPERLIACWVNGVCVPENYALHDALMDALGLSRANGTAEKRMDATMLYTMIDERFRTNDPNSLLPPEVKRKLHLGNGHAWENGERRREVSCHAPKRTSDYYDRPAIPKRRKPEHVAYNEMATTELKALLGDGEHGTRNAHEFLCAFQALDEDLRDTEVAEKLGCSSTSVWAYRNGRALPGKEYLPRFKALMDAVDPRYYPRFEALVISNRLSIVESIKAEEKKDPEHQIRKTYAGEISQELGDIPQSYWIAMVLRCNHPFTRTPPIPRNSPPEWVLAQTPIEVRGDYMRAVRLALGQSATEVRNLVNLDTTRFAIVEHYGNHEHEPIRERLVGHYHQQDSERMAAAKTAGAINVEPFYNPATYRRMPSTKRIFKNPRGVKHEGRVADAPEQASGMALGGSPTPPRPALPGAPPAPPADA